MTLGTGCPAFQHFPPDIIRNLIRDMAVPCSNNKKGGIKTIVVHKMTKKMNEYKKIAL